MQPIGSNTSMNNQETKLIAGYRVHCMHREQLAAVVLDVIEQRQKRILLFANTNFVVQCRPLLSRINQPDCIVINDGVGMDIAALLLSGRKFQENLNGTDFTPYLFRHAPRPLRVFMVGGKPDILALAVSYVQEQLGQEVVGNCDGYAGLRSTTDLTEQINQSHADIVLVAIGNPLQEQWIMSQIDAIDGGVMMGVGALFDFWSGTKKRAPVFIQKLKLEWLFRMAQEPGRLMRRYTIGVIVFLFHCFKYR